MSNAEYGYASKKSYDSSKLEEIDQSEIKRLVDGANEVDREGSVRFMMKM